MYSTVQPRRIAKLAPRVTWSSAVTPAPGVDIWPVQGYRAERHHNRHTGMAVPALVGAADEANLFEVFFALIESLGSVVDVYLESSHPAHTVARTCLRRQMIDMPVLSSIICDFEDLLIHDGCTSITVAGMRSPVEVKFDEHKHFIVYAWERQPFGRIFKRHGLHGSNDLTLLFDVPHVHHTTVDYAMQFSDLADALDMGETNRVAVG